jgi:XapX domain-containing protein
MKTYLMSVAAGLLVGLIYSLIHVRSPAPPAVALVGLLGILAGEQLPTLIGGWLTSKPITSSWIHQIQPHMFGHLPRGHQPPGGMDVGAAAPDREGSPS